MATNTTKKTETEAKDTDAAEVAYYYLPNKNLSGAQHPGVPLRNILAHEAEALPKWLRKSLEASPMYSTDKPKPSELAPATQEEADTENAAGEESEK